MKARFLKQLNSKKAFTLIEVLIYGLFLVIISAVAVSFFIQVVNVTETSRRGRESLENARRGLDVITQEIRHADSVYAPTSVLDTTPGQLGLQTKRDLPTDEDTTYVDFYVDDDRLYIKRESESEQLITSEKVRVNELTFSLLNDASQKPAIQVKITVEYVDAIYGPGNAVTLVSTATLRSYE